MPLSDRGGRRGTRKFVDGPCVVQRITKARRIRIGILTSVVNLDLVALRYRDHPIISRIRKANEDTGVVSQGGGAPIEAEDEVLELLSREPQQTDAIDRFDDVAAPFHKAAGTDHFPASDAAGAERRKARLRAERFAGNYFSAPASESEGGERWIRRAESREKRRSRDISIGDVMKTTLQIRHRIIGVLAHPESSGLMMGSPDTVARLRNDPDLRGIVIGNGLGQVESGFVHRVPERDVVQILHKVDPGPAQAELISLVAQIHPARSLTGLFACVERTVADHLANAAQGYDNPVFLL